MLTLDERTHVLYTRGSVPFFGTYPGLYVPRPLSFRTYGADQSPRALAAEIIGVAERALDLAVEHTSSRRQFNAPIAAFQAVRHRLADAYVAIAAARALLDASFADGSGAAAIAAKARAGRAHQLVSACAVQVCGAMGATFEHPLHRYVNRGAVLDGLLGSSAELTLALGALVRASVRSGGDIPLLVEV